MEACRKKESVKPLAGGALGWPAWIQALQRNSCLLHELLGASDWEGLRQAIRDREKLLQEASERLGSLRQNRSDPSDFCNKADIKASLEKALGANRELEAILQARRRELKSKIGEISKGRKLLNLYKTHRQAAPRFFDRFG